MENYKQRLREVVITGKLTAKQNSSKRPAQAAAMQHILFQSQ
jgi:hypothetical protein